jgi:PIN domain nuclease of toxin-antitoxin system
MITAAVADTHALVFHAAGSVRAARHLGKHAAAMFAAAERRAAVIYVPIPVMWECTLLNRIGRIDLQRPAREFFTDLFSNPAYQPLDLTPEQIYIADEMRPNNDPFDALVCAAARHLDLPLLTRDADIEASGLVSVVW